MALYHDLLFCSGPTWIEFMGPSIDQLEDTLLSSPLVSQGRLGGPPDWGTAQSSRVSASTLEGSTSPPPYAVDNLEL